MKKVLCLLLTAALLAGCNKESDKAVVQSSADPALVSPASELLAQLKIEPVKRQPVAETLRPGEYTVAWHVVSVDGHKTKGQYTFSVK